MRSLPVTILLLAVLLLAGCGDDDSTEMTEGSPTEAPVGALDHVDGTITVTEDGMRVAPERGDPVELQFSPEVQLTEVRALEAAGAKARVSYRDGAEPLVAVAVQEAPRLGEGLESYEGLVAAVATDEIVIDGADGDRTFEITQEAQASFDVDHLQDHATQQTPIRVYFDPSAPTAGIAYEDA